ncbi:class I SAM-dependent methyltransferase [Actinomarinicola tropica]|uniref:Methyltransferase domain-containing protein n=1 Tax=Actinomarinicola tropica TaxID=2789776 RepID=A0A5Q2RMM4_9ACTN|nr:class I SAM-dependent methyltransferase [Actinomarinicola tropica]QGG96714.1 methyltransferase domain-containing protein [Actinomarinicola tropica]
MGLYAEHVVPRIVDLTLRGPDVERIRERVCFGLSGEVLEVGFGSGRNLPHMPVAVTKVLAVDPSSVGRDMAAERVDASPVAVEWVGLDGEHLPLPDGSADHALSTWTLCTIPDVDLALREVRRVLRPGGTLHFVEHGLAPDPRTARRQHRFTPVQRRIAGGCHLDRPIDELIGAAGFRIDRLDTYLGARPAAFGWFYEGVATPV